MNLIYVALGGVLGALLRYGSVKLFNNIKIPNLGVMPISVILVNIIGSFLFGLLLYLSKSLNPSETVKLFLFTGFLGSYTTYSTFIYEFSLLFEQKHFFYAFSYLGLSFFIPFFLMTYFLVKL